MAYARSFSRRLECGRGLLQHAPVPVSPPALPEARLAELLGGLSLACDLADGFRPEKVLRTVVLAIELGTLRGLPAETLREVYYTTLVRYVGCTAFSHEEAHWYGAGDDINTRETMAIVDGGRPLTVVARIVSNLAKEADLLSRARAVMGMLGDPQVVAKHARAQCEAATRMAGAMGLSAGVHRALSQICERYDGKGEPNHVSGDALELSIRLSHLADVVEIAHHRGGREAALDVLRSRAGTQFDPELTAVFLENVEPLFAAIEGPIAGASVWERYLALEPEPHTAIDGAMLDVIARSFAEFADVKSTYTLGHSTGVAALVERAAGVLGFDAEETALARRAALLHDIGRVAVPNGIWDKPGPLSVSEWERVRLHAYYTERVVWRCPPLRAVAPIASAAHERLDGAGYHRAVASGSIARSARVLAAADMYCAMREPRPHRPAQAHDIAVSALRAELATSRMDREVVAAVLEAAGEPRARVPRSALPAGLTEREVEVLRKLARGRSNKQIASELAISARTVQHHVMHIYGKINVSSRAAAALFATDHELLD